MALPQIFPNTQATLERFASRVIVPIKLHCPEEHRPFAACPRPVLHCAGDVPYPLVDELYPELKATMHPNLAELKDLYPNVIVVSQDDILPVTSKDFADLIHFNEDAQRRFSDRFSEWMDKRFFAQ